MNVPCLSFKVRKMMILTMIWIIVSCCVLLKFGCLKACSSNSKQVFFILSFQQAICMSNACKSDIILQTIALGQDNVCKELSCRSKVGQVMQQKVFHLHHFSRGCLEKFVLSQGLSFRVFLGSEFLGSEFLRHPKGLSSQGSVFLGCLLYTSPSPRDAQ